MLIRYVTPLALFFVVILSKAAIARDLRSSSPTEEQLNLALKSFAD